MYKYVKMFIVVVCLLTLVLPTVGTSALAAGNYSAVAAGKETTLSVGAAESKSASARIQPPPR